MGKPLSKKHWAGSSLINTPVEYGLFLNPKDFAKALKKMGLPNWDKETFIPEGKGACVNVYENQSGEILAFVCLSQEKIEKESIHLNQVHALILHEAVHIWQHIKDAIGEKEPSKEFEAYSIQRISQNLFYLYDELSNQ